MNPELIANPEIMNFVYLLIGLGLGSTLSMIVLLIKDKFRDME